MKFNKNKINLLNLKINLWIEKKIGWFLTNGMKQEIRKEKIKDMESIIKKIEDNNSKKV